MDLVTSKPKASHTDTQKHQPGASLSEESMKKMRFAHEYPTVLITPIQEQPAKAS